MRNILFYVFFTMFAPLVIIGYMASVALERLQARKDRAGR